MTSSLFEQSSVDLRNISAPLAERMRPNTFEEIVGHQELVAIGKPFRSIVETSSSASFILYGPPGCGKTTIVNVIAKETKHYLEMMSAMSLSVSDIKKIASSAALRLGERNIFTIVFVDEIHRLTRVQQDALLPHVERGTFRLIGATTENPYVSISAALRSRMSVYPLTIPTNNDIVKILLRAVFEDQKLIDAKIKIDEKLLEHIANSSSGDVRFALGVLETLFSATRTKEAQMDILVEVLGTRQRPSGGEEHYDVLSAFIKSMRGSNPDGTIYYLARLIDAGEDPIAIMRRIVIAASEDVGLADSRVLGVVNSAAKAVSFVGMPESRIILAHAALAVARAPKSNSAYVAIDKALDYIKNHPMASVPHHLRDKVSQAVVEKNPAKGSKLLETYKYPHAYGGYVDQTYLPGDVEETFYVESQNGAEST